MHRHRRLIRAIALTGLLGLLAAGCAAVPRPARSVHARPADPLAGCAELLARLDRRAEAAGALDAGAFRVAGHPYLRVDRFTASFRDEVSDPDAFSAWVDRMQALDLAARRLEIADSATPVAGDRLSPADEALLREAAECGNRLKAIDFATEDQRRVMREQVSAPDDYLTLPRILGAYPVVSLFVSRGVSQWHAEARRAFSNDPPPPDALALRYVTTAGGSRLLARALSPAPRDSLGVPVLSPDLVDALFEAHAPEWRLPVRSGDDRIGSPVFTPEGPLAVDTGRPAAFTLLSYTRFDGEVLAQLSYVIWFPGRPRTGALDLYGGFLDGVIYRVTLDTDGEPLLYETVHACGCYYEAYPTDRLRPRDSIPYPEPPLILSAPGRNARRLGVELESGTHYVTRLFEAALKPEAVIDLPLVPYERLRSLPLPEGGRRSMFAPDGIVPGSERLERFLLWPTGVASPGAMRQWGRHAVAFVGERHFDDPFALDRMFVRRNPGVD